MQSVVAQTNHQKTKIAVENKWHGDLFTNGEKPNGKNPTKWFSSHHFRNSTIIKKETVTSKESQVPYQPTVEPLPQYSFGLVL